MNMEYVSEAMLIEVESILRDGWSASVEGSMVVVVGRDGPDFVSEVWRIAKFIAYADYVSLERVSGHLPEYRVFARSRRGLEFAVSIRANE